MKKLLLGSLILSSVVMGARFNGNSDKTGTMTVKAEVIQPLVVKVVENIDLGKIVAGANNISAMGEFEISGEKNSVITTEIDEIGTSGTLPGQRTGEILLTNASDSSKTLKVSLLASGLGENLGLGNHGKTATYVKATTNVPVDQASGIYNGDLTLKVRYN